MRSSIDIARLWLDGSPVVFNVSGREVGEGCGGSCVLRVGGWGWGWGWGGRVWVCKGERWWAGRWWAGRLRGGGYGWEGGWVSWWPPGGDGGLVERPGGQRRWRHLVTSRPWRQCGLD